MGTTKDLTPPTAETFSFEVKPDPAAEILNSRRDALVELRDTTVPETQEQLDRVGELREVCTAGIKAVHALLDDDIQKAYELHRSMTATRKAALEPFELGKAACDDLITRHNRAVAEQERQRRIAEARRLEAERKKIEDQKAKQARDLGLSGHEARRVAREDTKDEIQQAQAAVEAPVAAPKAKGVKMRVSYSAEVADLKKLLQCVIDGTVPPSAVQVHQPTLNGLSRQWKGAPSAGAQFGLRFAKEEKPIG